MTLFNTIQLSFAKVTMVKEDIIYTEFYSNENFDVAEAKQVDEARYQLSRGKEFYSIAGLVNIFGHMTKNAQLYFANDAKCRDLIKHEVILVDSLSIRILAKYYIKWIKPPYKIEVTKDLKEGLQILSNFTNEA
jgi:hypothetical protein